MAEALQGGRRWFMLLACVVGIYVPFSLLGLAQEEINTARFGPDQVKFHHTMFLVFCQCAACALVALFVKVVTRQKANTTPATQFLPISLLYVGAMLLSNHAIQYLNYPTMVLAKSSKPISVLLGQIIVHRRLPSLSKLLCVLLTVVGIVMFSMTESREVKSHGSKVDVELFYFGLGLTLLSLSFDGIYGPMQDALKHSKKFAAPSSVTMMFYNNLWAALILGFLVVVTGEMREGVAFCVEHPSIVPMIAVFAFTLAVGQNFIYYTVVQFDSLMLSLVTTTRKFFSIVISVIVFGHHLNMYQWLSVGVVFVGLGLFELTSKKSHAPPKKHE
eukprot:TRINITY_DN15866_c0_g1_i1.p1 TRINITY_DN15866_c0_g1~~TRINITY_DN15866_c0_g1_i1.p1  ORF type:complete len:331 (-),score=79.09 TRINITY_DN15866_c0_g1_i1:389-1381(-)